MNVRSQVEDVVAWYFSHIDPINPNYENVQRYLRGPLIALTVNYVLPAVTATKIASIPADDEEEKKSGSDWRAYLHQDSSPALGEAVIGRASEKAQEAYKALSRRTQARMEAFLAGCALAAPNELSPHSKKTADQQPGDLVSLQEGLSGFGITSAASNNAKGGAQASIMRNISSRSISVTFAPQIPEEDLIIRMDLYIRTLQRVRNLGEDCVIAMEPPKMIKTRAKVITYAFVATAGTIRNLRHVLTRLLNCLTMEVLAVEVLSDDVKKVIRRIVSEYEHGTSFASLAFLSTPEVNAESLLTPLVVKYLRYLQTNWEQVISACELERMLTRALDTEMRKLFKTIEFRSIGHLLEVCHEYRGKLENIELAPHVCAVADNINNLIHSKEALRQAIRDLQREIITVNGHVLPPVNSRKDLLNVLRETLNSRTLTASERTKRHRHGKKKRVQHAKVETSGDATPTKTVKKGAHVPETPDSTAEESSYLFSSEAESSAMGDTNDDSSLSEGNVAPTSSPKKSHRRSFHVSTIDILTRRLLIASSRTGNGGDAYFVVRDLFGGEDVEVVPTHTNPMQSRMVRPGTIDILVRLASVTIKCHQSFDIYPKALVGDCEPLIQFHTTTTETISLQEVRPTENEGNGNSQYSNGGHMDEGSSAMLMVQEQENAKTGWRTISIRPAIYEKVEVWGTPS